MIRKALTLVVLLISTFSWAQNKAKLKPLLFQADKNNLQVLPQRFEYTFMDENRLKVGDILIDTTQVTFHIEPGKKKGLYNIRFTWPAGLLKDGELALKNNSGKAIFSTLLNKKDVQISQGAADPNLEENLRTEIASFTATEIEAPLVDDMKYYPFMVFCIYKESDETRLYLCSQELFLSSQDGQISIKSRNSTQKTAQIEINGKVVGNQGIIYLNDRSENVAFRAQTQTGAFLEIETRKKDVDFKDVVESDDGKKIILTASGAEPVNEDKVKKINETDWQISLSKGRPLVYLKGDGDIPMKQEFYIRGPLPKEKNRPFLSARASSKTYSSSLTLLGVAPDGTQVKTEESPAKAKIEVAKKNQFSWRLTDIAPGTVSRRYLSVRSGDQNYTVGYDIYRGQPFTLGAGLLFQAPASQIFGTLSFQWWIENLFNLSSPQTLFSWGLGIERYQHLTEPSGVAKVDITAVDLIWRAQPGFHLLDETWGLNLPLQMIQGEGASAMAYGIGAYISKRPMKYLKPFMQWSELKFDYLLGSTGSDFKVSSAYRLRASGYIQYSPKWYLRYGGELSSYKFDPAAEKEDVQLGLSADVLWRF